LWFLECISGNECGRDIRQLHYYLENISDAINVILAGRQAGRQVGSQPVTFRLLGCGYGRDVGSYLRLIYFISGNECGSGG